MSTFVKAQYSKKGVASEVKDLVVSAKGWFYYKGKQIKPMESNGNLQVGSTQLSPNKLIAESFGVKPVSKNNRFFLFDSNAPINLWNILSHVRDTDLDKDSDTLALELIKSYGWKEEYCGKYKVWAKPESKIEPELAEQIKAVETVQRGEQYLLEGDFEKITLEATKVSENGVVYNQLVSSKPYDENWEPIIYPTVVEINPYTCSTKRIVIAVGVLILSIFVAVAAVVASSGNMVLISAASILISGAYIQQKFNERKQNAIENKGGDNA